MGAAGCVTVIMAVTDAVRFAASVAVTVMVALPTWPMTGVTEIMHDVVDVPQVEGVIVTPATPEETRDAGINDAFELLTVSTRLPTPVSASGLGVELVPPTTDVAVKPLSPGA